MVEAHLVISMSVIQIEGKLQDDQCVRARYLTAVSAMGPGLLRLPECCPLTPRIAGVNIVHFIFKHDTVQALKILTMNGFKLQTALIFWG